VRRGLARGPFHGLKSITAGRLYLNPIYKQRYIQEGRFIHNRRADHAKRKAAWLPLATIARAESFRRRMDQTSSATVERPRLTARGWAKRAVVPLPAADPGTPDTRSPARLLLWVGRHQVGTLVVGVLYGVFWMVAQALMPFAIGRAVEDGIVEHDNRALALWTVMLLGLGATQAFAGVMRHRYAVFNWLQASFRLAQVVGQHAARAGPAIRGRLSTGEVVATVSNDAMRAGGAFDITARLAGALVSYAVVAFILLSSSIALGLVVLLGLPMLVLLLGTVIKPLQARQREQREEVGRLTALGADTAAGLRVLRGIGGEQAFFDRYRARSQEVRRAGVRVALPQSTLDAAQVFVPGLFVVLVTWLGARFALSGRIGTGDLVAFYGYAAFLVIPLRTSAEAVDKVTRALVGARRMLDVLEVEREVAEPELPATEPPRGVPLADARSGLVVEPGLMTCLVSSQPHEVAALADRLGRFGDDDGVTLGDVRLADLSVDAVRRRVVVSEADPVLFSGTLRSALDPWGRAAEDNGLLSAASVANAEDVLEALPAGLETRVDERGRSFSGGQRQRLVLARALLSDAELLVLVEPTSAVDAHTEARIAQRLRQARAGRTTVVVTTSPLVLDQADRVVLIEGGRVVAEGGHRELLRTRPDYRETVTRGEDV
jgi:ABC-type multidrug transport system fused ATPase/permease subunit